MGAPEDEHDSLTAQVLLLLVNDRINEVRQLIIDAYEGYGFGVNKVQAEYREGFIKKIDETTKKLDDLYKEYKEKGLSGI